jgi:enoyl-CoA hydratase/carnithine racemase
MTNSSLITHFSKGVLHIEFNRPEKKNAITLEMYGLAAKALEQANEDSQVRAVIISGRGDCFTSGNDLMDFLDDANQGMADNVMDFLKAVPNCTKPIIAAVHGHAIGIGTTLLLHCDLVYAEPSALFKMPFVNLGLCPEFASSILLPQLIGHRRAAELLLLGKAIDAETAYQYGLINEVVDNAVEAAQAQAATLAALPASAIRATKALLHQYDKEQVMEIIQTEGAVFAQCMHSPEAIEAMTAFMERRQPDFSQFD